MLQEEKNIFSLLCEPLKIAGFELIEVKIGLMNTEKTIQLFIDSTNGIQLNDCINANHFYKSKEKDLASIIDKYIKEKTTVS